MDDQNEVKVQQFTRVHLVPRVNQGQSIALAFELADAAPVAYGAPVHVMEQIFAMVPQVLAEAKKIRQEAGLGNPLQNSSKSSVMWHVKSVGPSLSQHGGLDLSIELDSCQFNLLFTAEQLSELYRVIGSRVSDAIDSDPKKAQVLAKKTVKTGVIKATKPKVPKATSSKVAKVSQASKPATKKKTTKSNK